MEAQTISLIMRLSTTDSTVQAMTFQSPHTICFKAHIYLLLTKKTQQSPQKWSLVVKRYYDTFEKGEWLLFVCKTTNPLSTLQVELWTPMQR